LEKDGGEFQKRKKKRRLGERKQKTNLKLARLGEKEEMVVD